MWTSCSSRDFESEFARRNPPPAVSDEAAVLAIAEVLDPIGDTCPECPPAN